MEHHYLERDGVRLHYVTAGSGPLVVLVHGLPQCWWTWRRVMPLLEGACTVAAIDIRGFNESSRPASLNDCGVLPTVMDVQAVADHLGHRRFVVVGHDIGAAVAWSTALHHPDAVAGLVTIGGAHPALFDRELRDSPDQQRASRHWLVFRRPAGEELLRADDFAALRGIFEGNDFFDAEDRAAYQACWRRPGSLAGMLAWCRREGWGPPEDGTPARGNYVPEVVPLTTDVPVVAIHGDADPYILPGCYRGLEEYASRLSVRWVARGGHWLPEQCPELVAGHVRALLGGLVAEGRQ
jgi:pimeloyl-ACP methyl ester carboxylesterase